MLYDYDTEHYDALKQRQHWVDKHKSHTDFNIIPVGLTTMVQREDSGS